MRIRISPSTLQGTVCAPASKSLAHRALICAGLTPGKHVIRCSSSSDDIEATISCLRALGAKIECVAHGWIIEGINPQCLHEQALREQGLHEQALREHPFHDYSVCNHSLNEHPLILDCNESGSTLRFFIPIVATLGMSCSFFGRGRLPERPLGDILHLLKKAGLKLEGLDPTIPDFSERTLEKLSLNATAQNGAGQSRTACPILSMSGCFDPHSIELPGNVSSQFITGCMLAVLCLDHELTIHIPGKLESRPYLDLTVNELRAWGVDVLENPQEQSYTLRRQQQISPTQRDVEGDWSNAAFWFVASALHDGKVTIRELNEDSSQGDAHILGFLQELGARVQHKDNAWSCTCTEAPKDCLWDMTNTPDILPPLAGLAALKAHNLRFCGTQRLRIKESDRLEAVHQVLSDYGLNSTILADDLMITGQKSFCGGFTEAQGDHRIAMLAAILASCAQKDCIIEGADAVSKSYPRF